MPQQQKPLFDLASCAAGEAAPVTIAWRHNGARCKTGTQWSLGNTGYQVRHCGHPTALFSWTGHAPDGRLILAPNGRAFMRVDDARAAVFDDWQNSQQANPSPARGRKGR